MVLSSLWHLLPVVIASLLFPIFDFRSLIVVQDAPACFKRLVTGRRLADRFIRRVLPCDSLRHCELACAIEKEFVCEGFNFRFDTDEHSRGSSCQLTSYPADHLDLSIDFNSDLAYDFFERDRNVGSSCGQLQWNSGGGYNQWGSKDSYLPPKFDPYQIGGGKPGGGRPAGWNAPGQYPSAPQNELGGVYGGGKIDHFYNKGNTHHSVTEGLVPPASVSQPSTLPPPGDECFIRARMGFRLERSIIVMSLNAPTLYDCEFSCANERKFTCNIFSFRYSSNAATDNCQLGERTIRQIDIYSDLVPDRDYDVYIRNEMGRPGCQPTKTWDSDCFERLRSGLRLDGIVVKFTINTQTLSECQLVCLHIKHFTCRALSYRYGSPTIGSPADNCILTDWPMQELDPTKHFVDDASYDFYHRGSYGHGCELDRWPWTGSPLFPSFPSGGGGGGGGGGWPAGPPSGGGGGYYPSPRPPSGGGGGYPSPSPPSGGGGGYPSPSPPSGGGYPTLSPPSGGGYPPAGPPLGGFPGGGFPLDGAGPPYLPPSDIPHKPPLWPSYPPPKGGSYPPPNYPPAYLPPRKPFDRPTIFSTPGFIPNPPTYGLGGYLPPSSYGPTGKPHIPRPTDQICYISYGTPSRLTPSAVRTSLLVATELDCKSECSRSREKSHFRCASISYRSGNCELSDIELRDLRPEIDFVKDPHYWLYSWDFTDARCYVPPAGKVPVPGGLGGGGGGQGGGGGVYINMDRGAEGTWQRFTVSGRPCKAGTYCTENFDVGVWSCPVDDGDWDYCCRAGHHCGYSEGYNYPWCYVGSLSRTQWRPCSNFYFPYQPSNRPLHWPVAYLHKEGPPNVTMAHQPSIVDSFLNSLKYEHARKLGDVNLTNTQLTANASTTSPPTFQVVENVNLIPDAEDPKPKPKDDQSGSQSSINQHKISVDSDQKQKFILKTGPPPTVATSLAVLNSDKSDKPLDAMTKMWAWGQAKYNSSDSRNKDMFRISNRDERSSKVDLIQKPDNKSMSIYYRSIPDNRSISDRFETTSAA